MSFNTSFLSKVLVGVCAGLLGIVLMLFSVPIISNVRIDFRYLAILLAALFGGILPTIIASIIIGIFRVLYFGITDASLVALTDVLLIIGFIIIASTKSSRKTKWLYSIIYLLIVTSVSTVILIKDSIVLLKLLVLYSLAIIFVSYIVFKYTEYLSEAVKIDRKLRSEATVDFLLD